ncbi:hypothetical protein CR513_35683, partial [Mucuna pruriens]
MHPPNQSSKLKQNKDKNVLTPEKYAKFLKEIISNKKKLGDIELVELNKEFFTIVLNKLPPKLKDLRSFTIPCTINNSYFDKAL